MKSKSTWLRAALAVFAVIALSAGPARAQVQTYPSKPVRLVVPYPPGGMTDILGRMLGQGLGEALAQPVVIENRPGANGAIGSDAIAKSAPDGYAILVGAFSTHVLNPLLQKLGYDPVRDFAPVGLVAVSPQVLVTNPQVPAGNVNELLAWLRARPGKENFGSYGNASASHLAGELLKSLTGVDMTHVPYKGVAPAQADLMGGRIALMFSDFSAMPYVRAGKLRALGVTSSRRSVAFPELPTVAEAGVPGFESSGWFAIYAPAGTPRPVVERLNAELSRKLVDVEFKKKLIALGLEPASSTPEQLAELMRNERQKWARVIADAQIKVE